MTTSFTDNKRFFALQAHQIEDWWPAIEPFILECEKRQIEWSADQVKDRLKNRDAQLWGFSDGEDLTGCIVTNLEKSPYGLIGRIWIASGEMTEESKTIFRAVIEPWFVHMGCTDIMLEGRKGWGKILPDYAAESVVYRKKLCSSCQH